MHDVTEATPPAVDPPADFTVHFRMNGAEWAEWGNLLSACERGERTRRLRTFIRADLERERRANGQ